MLTSLNSGLIKPKGLHRVANGNEANGAREKELAPSHQLLNWTTVQGREWRSSSLIILEDAIIPYPGVLRAAPFQNTQPRREKL